MSLKFAESFKYMQQETFVHRLDPRTKGIFVLFASVPLFLFSDLGSMVLLLVFFGAILALSGLLLRVVRGLGALSFLFLFILCVNTLVQTLNSALIIVIRFLLLMAVFSVLFQTTAPDEMSQGLLKLRVPYSVAFSLSLAFRFIPTMAEETEMIVQAQKSRGHRFEEGGFIQKLRNFVPLIIPLIMGSIRRAFHVAEALETRCFGITKRPKYYFSLKIKPSDIIVMLLSTAFCMAAIALRILSARGALVLPWLYNLPL